MRPHWIIVALLCGILTLPSLTRASPGDLGTIIEAFAVRQFPDAQGRYWAINDTQWEGDEMVVDMHTIVSRPREAEPTVTHFLLLIVAGEIRGIQNLPLEPNTGCHAEEDV